MFLNIFKHLLPTGRAWRLTVDKPIRKFFDGLSVSLVDDIKTFYDDIHNDVFPQTTRELGKFEKQFGLPDNGLSDQERRDRLDSAWRALGGQDPRYIQDTLQGSGFNVFVHEWWIPGSEPLPGVKQCVIARNPNTYLVDDSGRINFITGAGEPLMQAGEATAISGDRSTPPGYLLVNKVSKTVKKVLTGSGELLMQSGEPSALSGEYLGFTEEPEKYFIPSDTDKWRYFLYIGDQSFGDVATVDPKRRDEFEALILKIRPAQQWLGMLINYS